METDETGRSFGALLKHYRKQHDLTQAALAQLVGCAAESIRKLEANRQRPSKPLAGRIADVFALSEEERLRFIRLARRWPEDRR
jgi:DNA-binding XRE family transcriptional regulator